VDLKPGASGVPLLVPAGVLSHPQGLHREDRVDHPLGLVDLRGKVHQGHELRPRLGILEGLTNQRESLQEFVGHVF
ncbi:MAG: hypothetical protein QOE58_2722, partial [Actinomycetota bacterium]|nr:hypothetical protein [Actinomycetota bacterium]